MEMCAWDWLDITGALPERNVRKLYHSGHLDDKEGCPHILRATTGLHPISGGRSPVRRPEPVSGQRSRWISRSGSVSSACRNGLSSNFSTSALARSA